VSTNHSCSSPFRYGSRYSRSSSNRSSSRGGEISYSFIVQLAFYNSAVTAVASAIEVARTQSAAKTVALAGTATADV
jgi:hypothetical protein